MALFNGTICCCCCCCCNNLCWFIICCFVNHSKMLFLRTRRSSADFWRWNCLRGSGGGCCVVCCNCCCLCFCGKGGRIMSANSFLIIDFGFVPVGWCDCCFNFAAVSMRSSKAASFLYGSLSSQCVISFFNASKSSGPEKCRWWCLWCFLLDDDDSSGFGNVETSTERVDDLWKWDRLSHSWLNSFNSCCWTFSSPFPNLEPLLLFLVCKMPFVGASMGITDDVVGPTWLTKCICFPSPVESVLAAGWCFLIVPVLLLWCCWWCCWATIASVFCSNNWANFFLSTNFKSPFISFR